MRIVSSSAGLVALAALAAAQAGDPASWNQPRGNAAGTAALALAGLHAQPVEEWRAQVGALLCEPVVWGGVVFAAAREENVRRLLAFRCQGGEPLGSVKLGRGGPVELAVWGGTVVVVDGKELESFSHRAGLFKGAKRLALDRPLGSPCVHEGRLLIGDGFELYCVEMQNLKLLARARRILSSGTPSVVQERAAALLPPEFPWPESADAPQRWMDWVEELLPAEAAFVARDDPLRQGLPEGWREGAVGLRTKNLRLFSTSSDPAVLGPCLRKGEGTLRALDELFPETAAKKTDPLQVHIYADRESFVQASAELGHPVDWSAGYYYASTCHATTSSPCCTASSRAC